MTDLSNLLERVKAATGPDRELDLALADVLVPDVIVLRHFPDEGQNRRYTNWRYTELIDDALALVGRRLPGWKWNVGHDANDELHATVWYGVTEHDEYAATAPLAILTAFLSALQLQTEK